MIVDIRMVYNRGVMYATRKIQKSTITQKKEKRVAANTISQIGVRLLNEDTVTLLVVIWGKHIQT